MQQNHIQNLDEISQLMQEIRQAESLLEFETIELPLQLVAAVIKLWSEIFSPEVLRQLANADTDTLDAWAIALYQTLQTQLTVLNNWLPHLSTLPVPATLKQKIESSIRELSQIATEKSQLLVSAATLLRQEQQLKLEATELKNLKQKARELEQIQTELQATNLENLREAIATQSAILEPEKQTIASLQRQKSDLDEEIAVLQQQKARLEDEINYRRSRQQRLETSTANTATELITLTKSQQQQLSEALSSVLADLEKQQSEFQQTQQQVQRAIEDFNQYQRVTEEMREQLNAHYQSDTELGSLLPVERHKVDNLIKSIQENLAELDRELAQARIVHSRSQQKTILTF